MAENYVESYEDDIGASEQFRKNSFTLKWLAMRNMQVEIALQYEKIKKTGSFIEDLDAVNKKISELKAELEEAKSIKRIKDKQHIDGQICNTLQSIVGPKNFKNRKSRYSVDQVKCIKDLLQKKQNLEKQKSSNQKEILSLEEKIETLKDSNNDSRSKKETQKDIASNITKEEFEKLDEQTKCSIHSRKLGDRSKMLAKIICALTEHCMSLDNASNEQLQSVVNICKKVADSQLQDLKEIHNFILTVHDLKL